MKADFQIQFDTANNSFYLIFNILSFSYLNVLDLKLRSTLILRNDCNPEPWSWFIKAKAGIFAVKIQMRLSHLVLRCLKTKTDILTNSVDPDETARNEIYAIRHSGRGL